MVGLAPIIALVAIFIWLGLSAREFDQLTRRRLFLLIVALVVLVFAGLSLTAEPQ